MSCEHVKPRATMTRVEAVSALNREAQERAIEALLGHVDRTLWDRLLRNMHDMSSALMAEAATNSPTAIRSLLAGAELLGGGPRRRWRKERRADEKRLDAVWEKVGDVPALIAPDPRRQVVFTEEDRKRYDELMRQVGCAPAP